jgi:hypothetical protein
MFKKLEKPKTVLVTRGLVDEFVNMETLPSDRPVSERRLMIYRKSLKAGEFRPVTWASALCEETGTTYRVNGKHTSILLSECSTLPNDFYVVIERYSCETMEDVARLYSTFDSSMSSRTSGDIVNSFASTVKEFAGLPKHTFPLVVAAASYHKWGFDYYSHPAPERAELLLDNIDFTIWLAGILYPKDRDGERAKHIIRSPVTAAMLGTWNKAKNQSDAFWKHVRDEDEPQGTPSRVLARYLSRNIVKNMFRGRTQERAVVTFREMMVRCIHAWNAHRNGASTQLKYSPQAKVPAIQ